jgi:phenylalanyl-tRNA synthetase beta chain
LRRRDPGNEAVVLSNPATIKYEVVHTSLIPEMLKTLAANKKMPLPIKISQIADVVLIDGNNGIGARNERRLCAVINNQSSGFEIIHGLVDRVMQMLAVPLVPVGQEGEYYIMPSDLPMYFSGKQAQVSYENLCIGSFGIIHPEVMRHFEVPNVGSLFEITIEPFL